MRILAKLVLVFALLMSSIAFAASDCGWCDRKAAEIQEHEAQVKRNTDLLGQNRAYLTKVDPKALSKVIKVESNIMVILQKIDQTKRDIVEWRAEMEQRECGTCSKEGKSQ